jgi:hypothetical protein
MQAYNKKIQIRKAREESVNQLETMMDHFDMLWLMTLHDNPKTKLGAERLRFVFRDYIRKYDDYKRRYLAADESTVCGDRTDTYALKKHLKEIGFDYDLECDLIRKELEERRK